MRTLLPDIFKRFQKKDKHQYLHRAEIFRQGKTENPKNLQFSQGIKLGY